MRSFILAPAMLSVLTASALVAAPRPTVVANNPSACPNNPAAHLARSDKGVFRKLAELPPAETYAAVYRRGSDGCMVPVLYRDRNAPPASAIRRP